VENNRRIGDFGRSLIKDGQTVLTHCNAGALATAGYGTALGIIRAAFEEGKEIQVYVDETRPFLQGARLTCWELAKDSIPVVLIADNMAGYLMKKGEISLVVTGADRIAQNGDTANKIGTYTVAVLAREHNIPFYVAAPMSTVDFTIRDGDRIPIEERDPDEVKWIGDVCLSPSRIEVRNPAFDVTPARYITAIVTEQGIARPPYQASLQDLRKKTD
jgi:methylthioribose-1-phosphate isomerase